MTPEQVFWYNYKQDYFIEAKGVAVKPGFRQVIHSVAQFLAEPAIPSRRVYQPPANVAALATGLRPLDKALELGGLPHSTVIELVESGSQLAGGGGAIIASRIAARVQHRQENVSIIDLSREFDPWQAERCGLAAPQLLLTRPETIFEALASLESAAKNAALVIVMMGRVPELLGHLEPYRRKTLLRRLQHIIHAAEGVCLLITSPAHKDPFDSANYPPGFPLAEVAAIRLWLQDENWTYHDGLATAYKTGITVIKNELATPGRGANIRVKLASP